MDLQQAMRTACEAATSGQRGSNPLVGAVVLNRDGELVGVGHHVGAGGAHAEVAALEAAGVRCVGGTLVVTLEPCSHQGRTPPCTQAIISRGVNTVVWAVDDPHHPGGGAALQAAGIEVRKGVESERAYELNRRWCQAVDARRPYVSAHVAQSVDGRIAAADGTSQWISSPPSRELKHESRARADAVLIGTGTALADDPRLSARTSDGALRSRQPLRVVMGQRPLPATLALKADERWVHYRHRDPHRALRDLYQRKVRHVLIEGGGAVLGAFIGEDVVDELTVTLSPQFLGAGVAAVGDCGVRTLGQARRFMWDPVRPVFSCGQDVTLRLVPAPPPEAGRIPEPKSC